MMIIMRRGRKDFCDSTTNTISLFLSFRPFDCLENWSHTVKMNDHFWLLYVFFNWMQQNIQLYADSIDMHDENKSLNITECLMRCNCDYNQNWLPNNISMAVFPCIFSFILDRCEIIKNTEALTCQMSTFDGLESSNWMKMATQANWNENSLNSLVKWSAFNKSVRIFPVMYASEISKNRTKKHQTHLQWIISTWTM